MTAVLSVLLLWLFSLRVRSVNDGGQTYLTRGAALAADYAPLLPLLNQPLDDKADTVKDFKHSLLLIKDGTIRAGILRSQHSINVKLYLLNFIPVHLSFSYQLQTDLWDIRVYRWVAATSNLCRFADIECEGRKYNLLSV